MKRITILMLFTFCTFCNSYGKSYLKLLPAKKIPESVHPKHEGRYIGLQATGIAMEAIGIIVFAAAIKTDFNNILKTNHPPNTEPAYIAGTSLLMAGVALNVFANAKLYSHGWKAKGNGISYTIPRTNKHFGM